MPMKNPPHRGDFIRTETPSEKLAWRIRVTVFPQIESEVGYAAAVLGILVFARRNERVRWP